MWLINSSIGRKVVMSVTGLALILFLTFLAKCWVPTGMPLWLHWVWLAWL